MYTIAGMGAGIGFRLRNSSGQALTAISNIKSNDTFDFGRAKTGANILAGSFEPVKTADATSGSFSFPAMVHVQNQEYANGSDSASRLNFGYTLTPTKVPSCSVSNPNVDVTLPAVSASDFKGVGTTTGVTSFSIGLDCEDNANPAITLTDSNMPTNQSVTLTSVSTSTAKGIGVQVLYNAQPLPLGPAPYSYSNSNTPITNRISLGSRSGATALALQGRYVQTDATVVPGTIRAVATFVLSYN
ncbi:fimbrial protein [Paraburkholderia humisilvae]|uniref:fimbrial protein n=1 Tax=Paraburkholderia humisilvae TaxID=627669 RepID=UPI001583ED59|nr:fimbrial protein [Paraburkholderia humisilvae]